MMHQAFAMNRVFKGLALPAIALATVLLTFFASTPGANAQTAAAGGSSQAGWYLALGDSVATGYQPGLGDDPRGGYVGGVLPFLRTSAPQTQLRNLACDGETSITFVSGGKCRYEEGSQLAQALVFLRAHSSATRLVTLTIGGNDLTPCLTKADPATCAQAALGTLAANLQRSLASVHTAAPGAKIVVTNYYDPFLALWFTHPDLAALSTALQGALNVTIASVTSGIGGATADVAAAFKSTDTALINAVPTNVATICQLTWMCTKNDDHPNDAGYAVIAATVVAKLA
jgi:lysophospholipase L1-like esterase